MLNLDHINVIVTIVELGSFQAASEKLNKARSAVSYSVKQFEEYHQVEIFDRSQYRPKLTDKGQLLLPKMRALIEHARSIETHVFALNATEELELKLGVSSNFQIEKISNLLAALKDQYPLTNIHLEVETASLERHLLDESLDLAIFTSPKVQEKIEYQKIGEMQFPLVIHKSLVAKFPDHFPMDQLTEIPQVIVKSSDQKSSNKQVIEDAKKWYVNDLYSKKQLILNGLGWGRMPEHMVEAELLEGDIIAMDVLGGLKLDVYVGRLKNKAFGPVANYIWKSFEERP